MIRAVLFDLDGLLVDTETLGIEVASQISKKSYFQEVISADDIIYGKPNPEGYLLAAKKLKIAPKECLVLEDSRAGVLAGISAKMKVFGVKNMSNQNLQKAQRIYKKISDITINDIKNI